MLFGDVAPDPGPAFWTVFFAQLPTLIAAVGAAIVACITAWKAQANQFKTETRMASNEAKIDHSISQNDDLKDQLNGHLSLTLAATSKAEFAKGMLAAQAAQVPTIAAAVAVGVAAAKKAEHDKPSSGGNG